MRSGAWPLALDKPGQRRTGTLAGSETVLGIHDEWRNTTLGLGAAGLTPGVHHYGSRRIDAEIGYGAKAWEDRGGPSRAVGTARDASATDVLTFEMHGLTNEDLASLQKVLQYWPWS